MDAAPAVGGAAGGSTEAEFDENDGEDLVPVLSSVLNALVQRDDKMAHRTTFTIFHALKPPAISIHKYLLRIFQYANCSRSCFVVALIYIDRIIQRNASFMITSLNIHRLLITSVMVAAKFFDDIYYDNAYYAKVGGIPTAEMNSLELEFLFMINFTLNVTPEVYRQYEHELMMHFRAADAQPAAVFGAREAGAEVPAPVVDSGGAAAPIAAPSIGHTAECDGDAGPRGTAAGTAAGSRAGGADDGGGGGMATPMHTDD